MSDQKRQGESSKIDIRARVAPRVALIKRSEEPLSRFFHRLGAVIYGTEWKEDIVRSLDFVTKIDDGIGSLLSCAIDVADQIRASLSSGLLIAFVKVIVARRPGVSIFGFSEDNGITEGLDPAAPHFRSLFNSEETFAPKDNTLPTLKEFRIRSTYWEQNLHKLKINWSTGTINLDFSSVDEEDVDYPESRSVIERYETPTDLELSVFIRDPDQALRNMLSYVSLPDEKWFSRYRQYRSVARYEVLAAGWRILALTVKNGESLNPNQLSRMMQEYLEVQGAGEIESKAPTISGKSTLNEMAANIIKQFENNDQNNSVLISSNRRNRK